MRFAGSVVTGFAEFSRPVKTSPLMPVSGLALLPWFFLATVATVAPIPLGALLSRSGSKRPIALVPIALASKFFAARDIRPLVSEFPALKASRRACLATFPTAAVIAVEARTAIFAMADACLIRRGIRLSGAGFFPAGLGKAALFEFLLPSPAVAGAVLAAGSTVTVCARVVVFVVFAGHERLTSSTGQPARGVRHSPAGIGPLVVRTL